VVDQNKKPIAVIGGGISGITAAVEASEAGQNVILLEKDPWLGGRVFMLHKYFPKLCSPLCGMEINFQRIRNNNKVRIMTQTEVQSISGSQGNFKLTVKTKPEMVNSNCTACNKCVDVCPEERSDDFNLGMKKTKAVYFRHPMAFPTHYAIDADACKGESCGKCVPACEYKAIDLSAKEKTEDIEVSSVIYATGWKPYDASKIDYYGFGKYKNVVNNVMMERISSPTGPTEGKITRPSDGKEVKNIAFVQCAGSRDRNHLPYCSAICCLASFKQATYVREQYPDSNVTIFYIDIRTPGKYDTFQQKIAEDPNVNMVKGKVAKIEEDKATGDVIVTAEHILEGKKVEHRMDMVVLATGMEPNGAGSGTGLPVHGEDGFIALDQLNPGMFTTGVAKNPTDVTNSLMDAMSTVLRTMKTGDKA